MPHMPDDDEGDIRYSLTEIVLGLVAAMLIAPGVVWWIGTAIGVFRATWEAFR